MSRDSWKAWQSAQKAEALKAEMDRLRKARIVWKQLGRGRKGFQRQERMIRELIETRGTELKRAYPDILGLGLGTGTVKGRRKPTPCLLFMVSQKLARVPASKTLPRYLLTYSNYGGRRVVSAIPTDVAEKVTNQTFIAQQSDVAVSSYGIGPIHGVVSVPINITYADGTWESDLFVLSCLHVLGMVQEFYPDVAASADFRKREALNRIGTLSYFKGFIVDAVPSGDLSFDAALGRIDSNPQAREALREVLLPAWPTKRVRNPEEISSEAIIQSHRKSIRATNRRIWTITSDDSPFSCEYRTPIGSITAAFPSVVIWNAHTEPGDSGSPVVSRTDPKLLLGMHIAGNDSGKAMMIPAYELFNPVRFGCPPGTRFIVPRSI